LYKPGKNVKLSSTNSDENEEDGHEEDSMDLENLDQKGASK